MQLGYRIAALNTACLLWPCSALGRTFDHPLTGDISDVIKGGIPFRIQSRESLLAHPQIED